MLICHAGEIDVETVAYLPVGWRELFAQSIQLAINYVISKKEHVHSYRRDEEGFITNHATFLSHLLAVYYF